jgi:hypothetical protein
LSVAPALSQSHPPHSVLRRLILRKYPRWTRQSFIYKNTDTTCILRSCTSLRPTPCGMCPRGSVHCFEPSRRVRPCGRHMGQWYLPVHHWSCATRFLVATTAPVPSQGGRRRATWFCSGRSGGRCTASTRRRFGADMLDQLTLSSQSLPLGGAAWERGAAMGRVLSSYLSNSLSILSSIAGSLSSRLRASGLSVLLLNHCFDLDAPASAAPPRGTQSGKPVARAACLPRLAREKRPTWYKNLP